ncbi:MAG: hypothetical protein ABII01_00425 [Candidatus Woesearchaeota archaeon]
MAWLDVADHVPMIHYGVMVSEVGDFQRSRFNTFYSLSLINILSI